MSYVSYICSTEFEVEKAPTKECRAVIQEAIAKVLWEHGHADEQIRMSDVGHYDLHFNKIYTIHTKTK